MYIHTQPGCEVWPYNVSEEGETKSPPGQSSPFWLTGRQVVIQPLATLSKHSGPDSLDETRQRISWPADSVSKPPGAKIYTCSAAVRVCTIQLSPAPLPVLLFFLALAQASHVQTYARRAGFSKVIGHGVLVLQEESMRFFFGEGGGVLGADARRWIAHACLCLWFVRE